MFTIGVISDHLSTTTGFKVCTEPFVNGFIEAGWDVHYLGAVGNNMSWPEDSPIKMTPVPNSDFIPESRLENWLIKVKPDVLFIVRDPGTLAGWAIGPGSISTTWLNAKQTLNQPPFKVIIYTPVEGIPMARTFRVSYELAYNTGGRVIAWTPGSERMLLAHFPFLEGITDYVYLGLDHFPQNKYSPEDRALLKEMAGMDNALVTCSVGTNKGTKGNVELLYSASAYKRAFLDERSPYYEPGCDLRVYMHTEPEDMIVGGQDLNHIRNSYNVEDIAVFKQKRNLAEHGNVLKGINVESTGLIDHLKDMKREGFVPTRAEEAMANMKYYSLTDLFAMSDLYLDLSLVEGWGLPIGEAMRFGLPVVGVTDRAVRDEIYGQARIVIPTEDVELWDTWNSGARLVKVRPSVVASILHSLAKNPEPLEEARQEGLAKAAEYPWKPSVDKMIRIITEVYEEG